MERVFYYDAPSEEPVFILRGTKIVAGGRSKYQPAPLRLAQGLTEWSLQCSKLLLVPQLASLAALGSLFDVFVLFYLKKNVGSGV